MCYIYVLYDISVYSSLYPSTNPNLVGGVYFIVSCRHSTLSPKWFGPEIKEGELSLHVQMVFPNKEIVHTF